MGLWALHVLTGACLAPGQSCVLTARELVGLRQETGQGLHLSQVLATCCTEDPQAVHQTLSSYFTSLLLVYLCIVSF